VVLSSFLSKKNVRYIIVKRCLFISRNKDFKDCGHSYVIEPQGVHYIKALIVGGGRISRV